MDIAQDLTISEDEDEMMDEGWCQGDPDDEDYQVPIGDEGCPSTHFYLKSCLVVLPAPMEWQFLLGQAKDGKVNLFNWIQSMVDDYIKTPIDKNRARIERLCRYVLNLRQVSP